MSIRCLAVPCLLLAPLLSRADPPAKARLDAHGFPLPEGVIARLGDSRWVQPDKITALAISPDGKRIATGGQRLAHGPDKEKGWKYESRVFLWDTETGRITREFPMEDSITITHSVEALAFSKNGRLLAAGMPSGHLTIWDLQTRKAHWPRADRVFASHKLRFLDNDRYLVACGDRQVQVWDVAKGVLAHDWQVDQARLDLLAPGYGIARVEISPSGQQMAWLATPVNARRASLSLLVQDTLTGATARTVELVGKSGGPHTGHVHLLDDGHSLLLQEPSPWRDRENLGENAVIDGKTGRERFRFHTRVEPYLGNPGTTLAQVLMASHDGKLLYTSDVAGTTCRDLTTGKTLGENPDRCWLMLASADGQRTFLARGARLQPCDSFLKPMGPTTDASEPPLLRYLADGRLMANEWHGNRLNLWDPLQGKLIESLRRRPTSLFSQGHDAFHRVIVSQDRGGLGLFDLVTNRERYNLADVGFRDVSSSLSPDSSRVLSTFPEKKGMVACWHDTRDGRELGRIFLPAGEMFPSRAARFIDWLAHDGSVFGYVTPDSRLKLVDCASRKVCLTVGVQSAATGNLPAWHYRSAAHDRFLLAYRLPEGPRPAEYVIWDRHSGEQLRRFHLQPRGAGDSYNGMRLSADGRFMGGSDGNELTMYETATGKPCGSIRVAEDISNFDFAPDGKTMAIACRNTTILILDLNRPLGDKPALPLPASAAETEKLWQALGNVDGTAASAALWALVRTPEQALPLLKQKLQPVNPEKMTMLVAQLDNPNFKVREGTSMELSVSPDFAASALRAALKKKPVSLEHRRRMEQLLARLEEPSAILSCLRELRAVELLERIGSTDARKLIESLATGDPEARLTREARLVLARTKQP